METELIQWGVILAMMVGSGLTGGLGIWGIMSYKINRLENKLSGKMDKEYCEKFHDIEGEYLNIF